MPLLLSRIPRETKVAAVVLAMALVQIGVLAALGLVGAERSIDDAERDAEERAADAAAVLAGFAAERVGAHEADAADETSRADAPAPRRAEEALRRAPVFRAAYLAGPDGPPRDARRAPFPAPPKGVRDDAARRALAEALRLEHADPSAAADLAARIADAAEASPPADPVAAALAVQAGARAARAAGDMSRAASLARRVRDRWRTVRDDRGALGEREPLGLSAAALLCDVLAASLANGSDAEQAAFVEAVADRRIAAQRFAGDASESALRIEAAECAALARAAVWLGPEARRRLDSSMEACDDVDRGIARISAVSARLAAAAASQEPSRLALPDGALLVVVPAPAAAPWTAIAFLADRTSLLDAAVRPAAARAESPPGTVMTVRDESGAVAAGDAALGDIAGRPLATMELGRSFPGLRATVVVADPEALAAGTRSSRRYWLFVLAGAALAVAAASVLAVRAVLREVRLARMKSDFVSNLSHELRTPLTSMRMFVETLQEGRVRDEAERKECIDVIAHETDRLSSLVDRVLTFASFAKGRAPIDLAPGDLADAARRAATLFRKRAESAGATLEVRVQGGVPEVRLDRDAVVQVILNLLDNAVKHAGHDGAKIRVTVAASEGGAAVSVDDDGPGVPERERELVFEEFYRGDDTLSRRTQGAGIGLALCRRIVLAHGGTVRAERSAGLGGASFRVWLPASARGAPGRDATAGDATARDTTSRDAPARGGDRAEATS